MSKNSLLLQPIQVGNLTLKNRVMFPPLTTGYEERDGSIGERSLAFYERLAKGGTGYVVIGDVAPVMTASPTPSSAMIGRSPPSSVLQMPCTSMTARLLCRSSIPSTMFPAWAV